MYQHAMRTVNTQICQSTTLPISNKPTHTRSWCRPSFHKDHAYQTTCVRLSQAGMLRPTQKSTPQPLFCSDIHWYSRCSATTGQWLCAACQRHAPKPGMVALCKSRVSAYNQPPRPSTSRPQLPTLPVQSNNQTRQYHTAASTRQQERCRHIWQQCPLVTSQKLQSTTWVSTVTAFHASSSAHV